MAFFPFRKKTFFVCTNIVLKVDSFVQYACVVHLAAGSKHECKLWPFRVHKTSQKREVMFLKTNFPREFESQPIIFVICNQQTGKRVIFICVLVLKQRWTRLTLWEIILTDWCYSDDLWMVNETRMRVDGRLSRIPYTGSIPNSRPKEKTKSADEECINKGSKPRSSYWSIGQPCCPFVLIWTRLLLLARIHDDSRLIPMYSLPRAIKV